MTLEQALMANASVSVRDVTFANDRPICVLAGPCQMESRAHALEMAQALQEIAGRLGLGLVYKTSFDKANRTSLSGQRGLGLDKALGVFAEIRETLGLPVVTDVRKAAADLAIHTMGITFTVYSDKTGSIDREWPFDIIPRIIPRPEWERIRAGLDPALERELLHDHARLLASPRRA